MNINLKKKTKISKFQWKTHLFLFITNILPNIDFLLHKPKCMCYKINFNKNCQLKVLQKMVIIHRPPIFSNFFKNTQFFFFIEFHLKLHFFTPIHFRLENVRKTNGILNKWLFCPPNEKLQFFTGSSCMVRGQPMCEQTMTILIVCSTLDHFAFFFSFFSNQSCKTTSFWGAALVKWPICLMTSVML